MLCIKNGTIVDGINDKAFNADILINDGRIIKISKEIDTENYKTIDADNMYIIPGLVDAHCHLREPGFEYKEDIASGTRSAAAGGFTSIACMANTNPPIDNAAIVSFIKSRSRSQGIVKVYPIGAITKGLQGKELTEMGDLKEAGAVALSDDGYPVYNPNIMQLALQYAKMFNFLLISHCEDMDLVGDGVMNEGYMSTILGLKGIPRAAEEIMVARDIILAGTLDAPIHIAHVSTKGSVEIIRQAKKAGIKVSCETAPHYFSATDEWIEEYNTNAKVNPPLRTSVDVEAIIEGLKDGTIDIIATDHAPHSIEDKNTEFDLATNGISGFETAFSLAYTNLVHTGILSMPQLIDKMSSTPARLLNIPGGKLMEGEMADITIVDPNGSYTVDTNRFYSKGKNSPFDGCKLRGKILYTIVDGNIVMEKGKICL